MSQGDLLHVVTADDIGEGRRRMGKLLIWGSFAVMVAAFAYCALAQGGVAGLDLETWRPALVSSSASGPRHGRMRWVRSTAVLDSHDLAEDTRRWGSSAPRARRTRST